MNDLDIQSISALTAANVQSQISTRVARKALDAAKDQGRAIVSLLESARSFSSGLAPGDASQNDRREGGIDTYA